MNFKLNHHVHLDGNGNTPEDMEVLVSLMIYGLTQVTTKAKYRLGGTLMNIPTDMPS